MAFLRKLEPLTVPAVVILFFVTMYSFGQEREARRAEAEARRLNSVARREEQVVRAWQLVAALPTVIAASPTKRANIGLKRALEVLIREKQSLTNINLTGGWAAGIEFPDETDLRWATFINTTLSDAYLHRANLWNVILINADLQGVCLRGALLTKADMRSADLRNADLRDAELIKVIFGKGSPDLDATNFDGTDISGADFTGAIGLQPNQFSKACADPRRPPALPKGISQPPECNRHLTTCTKQ